MQYIKASCLNRKKNGWFLMWAEKCNTPAFWNDWCKLKEIILVKLMYSNHNWSGSDEFILSKMGVSKKLSFNKNSFCFTPPYKGDKKNFITIEWKNGIHLPKSILNFRVCLKFYYFAPSGKRVTQQALFYFTLPALPTGRQATSTSVVKVFPDFDGTYLRLC